MRRQFGDDNQVGGTHKLAVQSLSTAPESFLNPLSRRIPAGNPVGADRLTGRMRTTYDSAGISRETATATSAGTGSTFVTAGRDHSVQEGLNTSATPCSQPPHDATRDRALAHPASGLRSPRSSAR
jgi:hypothetical protein